jgi:hypothetical protein
VTPARASRRRVPGLVAGAAVAAVLTGCTGAGGSDAAPSRGVTCDVDTCTLTLRTAGARQIEAFGADLTLDGVEDGVASLVVGDARVECGRDEAVRAGALTLFCDDVTAAGVTLTAEVG